ncbi:MAG: hypothetical protein LUF85_11205 [Bacteroides sp.]|nr:hypothetical protein [Bacteroides sp.]
MKDSAIKTGFQFLVVPLKKKSKSRNPLKVNDFQGILFSSKSQKTAKSHICGDGIGDFFRRLKKSPEDI